MDGQLRGVYGGAPWLEGSVLSRRPSSTQLCFEALLGLDERTASTSVAQMRAWVSAGAPPLVYDAARARHEQQQKVQWRDHLAARWRAKAQERERDAPKPPPSFRVQREITAAKVEKMSQARPKKAMNAV